MVVTGTLVTLGTAFVVDAVSPKLQKIGIQAIDAVIEEGKKTLAGSVTETRDIKYIPVRCNLASSFGQLNNQLKEIDDELKIMISTTLRQLERTPAEELGWQKIMEICNNNGAMQKLGEPENYSSTYPKNQTSSDENWDWISQGQSSIDRAKLNELQTWFVDLVGNDKDILDDTKIDLEVFALLMSKTGATVKSLNSLFAAKEYNERTMIDISILRFPDIEHPYFRVYRIELKAWSDCSRKFFKQKDVSAISGKFNAQKFGPRDSVMQKLQKNHDFVTQAKNDILAMFGL